MDSRRAVVLTVVVTLCSLAAFIVLVFLADAQARRRRRKRLGTEAVSVWQLKYDLIHERASEQRMR